MPLTHASLVCVIVTGYPEEASTIATPSCRGQPQLEGEGAAPNVVLGTAGTLAVSRVVLIVTSCPLKEAAALPTRSCTGPPTRPPGLCWLPSPRLLGERSASVAQAALHTLRTFGEQRDAVIATVDTGSGTTRSSPRSGWDRPWNGPLRCSDSWSLTSSSTGRTPTRCLTGTSPQRVGTAGPAPSLAVCLPGTAAEAGGEGDVAEDAEPAAPVTDEEARNALHEYEEIQDIIREFEDEKRWAVEKLRAWLGQQGVDEAKLEGREKDPLRGHGDVPPLFGGLPAAQQPA